MPGARRKQIAASLALPECLERAETLDAVEKVGAEVGVGPPPGVAGAAVPTVEGGGGRQGEDGEPQHDQSYGNVQEGHVDEYQHGGGDGHDHLGEVLAEEVLQPLHTLDEGKHDVAGAGLVEMAGPEVQGVLEEVLPDLGLDDGGRVMADDVPEVEEAAPRQHEGGGGDEGPDQGGHPGAEEHAGDDAAGHSETGHAHAHG